MWGNSWKRVEAEYGKPMGVILPELANELPTLEDVARTLNVDYSTLWKWAKQVGLECVYVSDATRTAEESVAGTE